MLTEAAGTGDLALAEADLPAVGELRVERPRSREHGDWASNVARYEPLYQRLIAANRPGAR